MSYFGDTKIGGMCLGDTEIGKAYLGDTLVFQKGSPVPLPYDAEVEYLESTGTQYIDTGIECTGDLSVELRAYWTSQDNLGISGGIISTGTNKYFRHHFSPRYYGASTQRYWYQNNTSTNASIQGTSSVNAWHTFSLNADTGAWTFDNATGSVTPLDGSLTTGRSYGLFARISSDGTIQSKASRFSYLKLSRGGVLLRNYIPVRLGQVGYMYDKVSHQLFGNDGTGDFIIGNDITP